MSTIVGFITSVNGMQKLLKNYFKCSYLPKSGFLTVSSFYSRASKHCDENFFYNKRRITLVRTHKKAVNTFSEISRKNITTTSSYLTNTEISTSANESPSLNVAKSKFTPILDNKNKIFVGAKNLDYDKNRLKKLFSKFGSIHSVLVPKVKVYDESPNDDQIYRYAFIFYNHESSARRAVLAGSISDVAKSIEIEIKGTDVDPEILRSVIIHDLPDYVKAKDIFNHFKAFGEIELVNFVYNATLNVTGVVKNFALIVFKDKEDASKTIETIHVIDSVRYLVTAASKEGKQRKDRCRKVLVKDIPLSECDVSVLKEYFSKIAPLQKVFILRDSTTNMPNGTALVEFLSQDGAQKAEDMVHEIAGVKVLAKALGWSNMALNRTLYSSERNISIEKFEN